METPDIELLDEPAQPDARTMRRILDSRADGLERFRQLKAMLLARREELRSSPQPR
jgi:hypothetical protein